MPITAVLRQQLYCRKCCNVFCAVCKANHTKEACLATAKGNIQEQDLIAAVSTVE